MADKTVAVRIVVRANQFSSGLKKTSGDIQRFAVDVERASTRAGSSALALGAASATAGKLLLVGVGGALVVSAKAAIDFESSLAGVAKTTDLAGSAFASAGSPLAEFGRGLRSLSQRIPLNVNDLARIAEMGGQLGVEVPNLIEFTEVMAALGVSTNLGAEEAATGLARFVNIMGTAQTEFGRLGSIVVALGNNLATSESEILTFGLRLAPVGRTVGLTEDEVLGLSGALTQLGVPAERGGTALQRFFLDMQKAVQSGGDSLENFARVAGTTAEGFKELFEGSPAQAFVAILQGLDRVQDEGGNAAGVLESLNVVQQRSIQVLLASSNGWETVADAIGLANDAGEDGNALFEEAARRYGTSASQIGLVSNAFNDLRIEAGNALLGSGGLAAGLDFLREFIRVIKDNLPLLGRLATAFATVAAIRIGAGFLQGIQEGISRLRDMRLAADGVSRSTAAMRLGMLGVNAAVFGAVAIASILITRWAATAAKAAELRRQARLLQEQIEQGVDPIEAFIGSLKEQGIITDDVTEALNRVGLSEEEFARRVLSGEGDLRSFNTVLGLQEDAYGRLAEMLGISREEVEEMGFEGENLGHIMLALNDAIGLAGDSADAFVSARTGDIRNALIEAGLGARFAADELQRIAEFAAQNQPFDIDASDIAGRIAGFEGFPEMSVAAGRAAAVINQTTGDIGLSWQEMVFGLEDGTDMVTDFFDTMVGATDDFEGALADSFQEVKTEIMGQFPTWDEYEQMSIKSLNGVIEAQDAYLADLRDGFELQSSLTGEVSAQVLGFIEGLDPATKGALARFNRTNETGFREWLTEVESNLLEAEELTGDFWGLKLPEAQRKGFEIMFGVAVEEAKKFGFPGEQTANMIMDGLKEQLASRSESERDTYLSFISDMFHDKNFLNSIGLDIGNPLVAGIISALRTLSSKAGPVLEEQAIRIRNKAGAVFQISSPSKMTQEIGFELTRGLFKGMDDEFDRQMRHSPTPIFDASPSSPQVVVNPAAQSYSRDLHIYYPEHRGDDVVDAISKESFLNNIVVESETTVGFG